MRKLILSLAVVVLLSLTVVGLQAEDLKFPNVSQKASLSQVVGMTEISVDYHRPGVKGREIWGKLVPFDKTWRVGANEVTLIKFSTDVKIEGQDLKAGTYGFVMIPGKDEWTVIFSKQTDIWGDMGYKPEEDALRVKVKPMAAPHGEWMRFGVDELSDSSARIYVHWEKLMIGFKLTVDTKNIVLSKVETSMGNYWAAPYRAADFAFKNDMLDKAKEWIGAAVAIKPVYWNMILKAKIYQKAGADKGQVKEILEKAIALIAELPEGQKSYAVEAAKMLKELK